MAFRAIPNGYMTVGELAKKMDTTVRTLQYYDKEGVLSPSAESEGGRRLYTDKDMVKLHQILSMKYLGFSLEDIKGRLISLDTPADVANALEEQADALRNKIAALSEALFAIEKLKAETTHMETVNWKKYADIVVNLQMKNEFYRVIKHFNDKTLDHIRGRFDKESGLAVTNTMKRLLNEVMEFITNCISPESEQGQLLAKEWWDMVMEFTGGDMTLLPELMKVADNINSLGDGWNEKWAVAESYITKALEVYFTNIGVNPFEGVEQ